jgi:photosystem II stability/assembly factor-like uncharacterized protein
MKKIKLALLLIGIVSFSATLAIDKKGKKDKKETKYKSSTFSGLQFRNIGPALTSGRIADIAVNPNNASEYYIAVASGGVWKTTNAGTTYQPIFDNEGSYSIGCVTIDPNNENVIWVGTGENNNQRSVAYGDGVYKSEDGGSSWKNVGLKTSEHIGKIIVDPNNSNIVYVAAMGPLWNEGGERGIYKTIDGGTTWNLILEIDKNTGVSDIVMDPRNPHVIYAASQQRRRHVYTYIGGGPGSGIHKTTDGGETWIKLSSGLPTVDVGRIGLAISPVNPDYLYAIIEASDKKGGFFKTTNRGASWSKMSDYSTSGNYYQEIYCDPIDVDKVFSMATWLHHTTDGGKTFVKTGEKSKHVDNHCIWINPNNTDHWIVGCDGGLYETWDHAKNWQYKPNLPLTQFYKVAVDNNLPFYNVYGGTQDNNSQGGPSRTITNHGIMNEDWFITNGGDGFESAIDPIDPNIVYAQSQYGWLVRYDKQSGERVTIKPQHKKGDPALRWNWDAPLLISPHNNKRLYFAANKLFKSDDRGDSWQEISGDLTRQLDRNKMKTMDRVWGMDAVMKNKSTTIFGNIVALDESPLQEGLLYIGTDDGLIQITEDNGSTWKKIEAFPGISPMTYVNAIVCSKHDTNTVYAVFNNHKRGDFKPYILKSTDKGTTWNPVHGDLPEKGSVYDIAEDHINPNLLFAGTEFGLFFSDDSGKNWTQLKSGLPTIAIRDIEIQERENDLVLASFGRGFYILDDYTPLRYLNPQDFEVKSKLYPIKEGLMFQESSPKGMKGKSSMGESFFTSPNPAVGAVFTYIMNDTLKTIKEIRQTEEAKIKKLGGDVFYPSLEEIKAEDNEEKPFLLFLVRDSKGTEVRKLKTKVTTGINRLVWDFRHAPSVPLRLKPRDIGRYSGADEGPIAVPGKYSVEMYKSHNGIISKLTDPVWFEIKTLNNLSLPELNKEEALAFQQKISDLQRAVRGAEKILSDIDTRVKFIKIAVESVPQLPLSLMPKAKKAENDIITLEIAFYGESSLSSREFEVKNSLSDRIETAIWSTLSHSSTASQTSIRLYEEAGQEFEPLLNQLKKLITDVEEMETELDKHKAPYTPGRIPLPDWKMD